MRYATGEAFRTALERRLLNAAQPLPARLPRLRKLVAFDRLLARLVVIAPDQWVLKGALALDYRFGERARSTRDLDLGHDDTRHAVTEAFVEVQRVDLGDYFEFVIRPTSALDKLTDAVAIRFRVRVLLANRRFEDVVVDVGVGERLVVPPDTLTGPPLLSFADLAPVSMPVISIEQHVAEKAHAYTRVYPDNRQNTRAKDLVDLVLIQSLSEARSGPLGEALRQTYGRHGRQRPPVALPAPPDTWSRTYPPLAIAAGIDPSLPAGHRVAAAFLDPVLSGVAGDGRRWSPDRRAWLADG